MVWNQILENVFCNSESYNGIYNNVDIYNKLDQIKTFVTNQYILPNMQFFSQMLKINVGNTNNNLYNDHRELNRRRLKIFSIPRYISGNDYIIFSVKKRYIFNFHSPSKKYYPGNKEVIQGKQCICIQSNLPNGYYCFETNEITIFHFTFHCPNLDDKYKKFKGAFHLKIDNLEKNGISPYRPFILDPRKTTVPKQFITWDIFNTTMNNYFTTTDTTLNINDIIPFLLNDHSLNVIFSNSSGSSVHYITDIIKPIYDKIVNDALNPLLATMSITTVPAVVEHNKTLKNVMCKKMMEIGNDNSKANVLTNNGRNIMMGGKTRKKR
jgi:hypothetical protein